ncbi:hypothetical protein GQ43DRAFT_170342 [Delitschia confertaspora ATCC 74209]|uniref:Uncharacterized protein n=1 Tax=Delitschia confertaspora ATCC 74209 TaxID=1513339 RepID=A0A9P4MPR9_9PLEO|nr:hypothetical protein GQ43DRAFT_170342 [Delitschia confertaspora ATCC 74209]
MSISKSASRCVQLLDIKAAPINLQLRPELENTLVRFKIWAGNIGVFAPGNASIDYRLRNDEDVSDILRVLLDRLRELLERAIRPPLEEEPVDDDDEIIDLRSNSSGSSSSISFDVNESDDTPASTQDRMTKANEILDDLYRLSAVLKKPASIERRCKSQSIYRKRYR